MTMTARKPKSIDEIRQAKKARTETVLIDLDEKTTIEFTFKGIGRKAFNTLVEEHQSQENKGEWDPETFPPALIAASCADPAMTPDEAKLLWDDEAWSVQELDQLFTGALKVNAALRGVKSLLGL